MVLLEPVVVFYNFRIGKNSQEKKGYKSERRMPRLPEARKDVVSCEKVRGSANRK